MQAMIASLGNDVQRAIKSLRTLWQGTLRSQVQPLPSLTLTLLALKVRIAFQSLFMPRHAKVCCIFAGLFHLSVSFFLSRAFFFLFSLSFFTRISIATRRRRNAPSMLACPGVTIRRGRPTLVAHFLAFKWSGI